MPRSSSIAQHQPGCAGHDDEEKLATDVGDALHPLDSPAQPMGADVGNDWCIKEHHFLMDEHMLQQAAEDPDADRKCSESGAARKSERTRGSKPPHETLDIGAVAVLGAYHSWLTMERGEDGLYLGGV